MLAALTITLGWWVVPCLLTLVGLGLMLRPYHSSGSYDFGLLLRLFWLIPISLVWLIYGLVLVFTR